MAKTVVILGAGWAGLPLAHKLLKYTTPKQPDLKVILVSPNSHFFWNVAATRGVIPDAIPDSELFLPIEPAFKAHDAGKFQFVLGRAQHVSPATNTVDVRLEGDGSTTQVIYDHLVVATGSQIASDLPFKPLGSHAQTLSAWHELQRSVGQAESIVVSGGGPTGVELAGELAAQYNGRKSITLVVSGDAPLASGSASVQATAVSDLKKLGVKLLTKAKVTSTSSAEGSGVTTVHLSNGSSLQANLYLPVHGLSVNASFMPRELLDADGNLNLKPDMRVAETKNIWGIGDVGNLEAKQLTVTDNQIIHLAQTLDTLLNTRGKADDAKVKAYEPDGKTMLFVSMGKKHATGQIGNWRLPGFMVNYVKGRRLFTDTAKGYVGGEHLRHAKM